MNQQQTKAVYALINKLNFQSQKDNIVLGISNGRTSSTKLLTSDETNDLIKYLKSQDPEEKKAEVMRKKIIAIAHEMHWHIAGSRKADMQRIDAFCVHRGHKHKKLNQYLYSELPTLVSQFEAVYKDYLKKI